MIYRVGDEITSYDNRSLKTMPKSEGQEKFSLDHYPEGQTLPDKEKKEEERGKTAKTSPVSVRTESGGVKLELSASGGERASEQAQQRSEKAAESSLTETVQRIFRGIIGFLKRVIDRVWNDVPAPVTEETEEENVSFSQQDKAEVNVSFSQQEKAAGEGSVQEQFQQSETAEKQRERELEIQKCLASRDMGRMVRLLTEDGQKPLARNSGLLTYYDRTGKIADVNASDRERILHGDRNVKKL